MKVILASFSSPYSLRYYELPEKFEAIIIARQDKKLSNEICAQVIMGGLPAQGTFPVSANKNFPVSTGEKNNDLNRLSYGIPEELGICSESLKDMDSIVFLNMKEEAIPGCQILVAKDGHVIYRKSFGYHTYKKGSFVKNTDIYDLASITKIAATTLSVMNLYDQGKLDVDYKLSWYLPYLVGTNKQDIIIREMMAHQAGLKAWIPFYVDTKTGKKLDKTLYSRNLNESHTVKVADKLYISQRYKYTMIDTLISSKLRKRFDYKYSDLGFYMLNQTIENLTNKPLDVYTADDFYNPLGLKYMCFNPLNRFKEEIIVPTEVDHYFRDQFVHGYVHDPGAAMLGGVSGSCRLVQ